MSAADLDKDVFIVCDCEKECRKDGHAISATLLAEGARCNVWISRRHLCVVAASTLKRIRAEQENHP